jgi:porin
VSPARAYDLTPWAAIGAQLAAGGQCPVAAGDTEDFDACRGGVIFQPSVSLRPTESDEFFFKLGLAAGNGLTPISPFAIPFLGADLEDDLRDMGGRLGYLLNAWLRHRFELSKSATLAVTAGIIDATDFIDDNAYSNDELAQFMNGALVNSASGILPAYDLGGALELDVGVWSLRGVVMQVGENDDGNGYTFGAVQLGYTAETPLGPGHYRAFVLGTSSDFLDIAGTDEHRSFAGGLSFDQQLGETFGAFLRVGWQRDEAAIDYAAIYSGGINVRGGRWGRPNDEIGAGYAFLEGGNSGIRATHAAEIYYRLVLFDRFAVTADAQFMQDVLTVGDGPQAVVLGLRATVEF